jgi:hypothetical protein
MVPAYTLPPNADHVKIMRALVKLTLGHTLAETLADDIAVVGHGLVRLSGARWSGEQSQHYARASATRNKAARASIRAGQLRIDDILYFNGSLNAHDAGNSRLAAIYRRRFRPEFYPPSAHGSRSGPSSTRGRSPDQPACRSTARRLSRAARGSTPPPTSSTPREPRPRATTTATSSPRSSSPRIRAAGRRCRLRGHSAGDVAPARLPGSAGAGARVATLAGQPLCAPSRPGSHARTTSQWGRAG